MIDDIPEAQDSPRERGRADVDGKGTDDQHPAWCSPEHCGVTDEGVRVHEQAPSRWEDDAAEVRCESRLFDPADDSNVYLELHLQNLMLTASQFHLAVPVAAARRLRDQLTAHLDAVQ